MVDDHSNERVGARSISRRAFLRSAAIGIGVAGAGSFARSVLAQPSRPTLIRGAHVLTMGPQGELAGSDVLVRDGRIERVGRGLDIEGAEVVNATGHVLLPGFVDTHTHIWLSQMRGLFGRSRESAYFPLVERLGRAFRPDDMFTGTLFGATGNLDAGITTTFPYCDNIRQPEDAEAALAALAEAGTRARFHYTGHDDLPDDDPVDLDHLRALHDEWERWSNGGLIALGLGWRVPTRDASGAVKARARRELDVAKALALPVSTHISGERGSAQLDWLISEELLAPGMVLVHATGARPDQLAAVRAAGACVALTPITEQRVGFGITRLSNYANAPVTLGIDGGLAGAPDMFTMMKVLHNVEVGGAGDELAVLPRRLLELATIEGARAVGMADVIGSIEPGKAADLALIDTRSVNMGPLGDDPSALLVYSAKPHNVAATMVAGRWTKRDGRLTMIDARDLAARVDRSLREVRERAE